MAETPSSRLVLFVWSTCLGAAAVAVLLAVSEPVPALVPLLLFGVLVAFADNLEVRFSDDISLTTSPVLVMAAVVAYSETGSLLGPMLVGAFVLFFVPHIRERAWMKLSFNAALTSLAAFGAAAAFFALPASWRLEPVGLLMGSVPAAVAFFGINSLFIAAVVSLSSEERFSAVVFNVARWHWADYFFAVLGMFLGYLYLTLGPAVVPLFVVPLFIARQTYASYMALKDAQRDVAAILVTALESKDAYTAGHVARVARYAEVMGTELGLGPARLERLRFAALMHDIGKLVVPNHLLNKPGRLTEEEFREVKKHEVVSVELLTRIDFLAPVAPSASGDFARYESSRVEGRKPIEPHIVHVADAFDAMTSTRSYRKALSQEVAFEELRRHSGTQFHPQCVEALIAGLERAGAVHGAGHEEAPTQFAVPPPEAGTGSAGLGDLAEETEAVEVVEAVASPAGSGGDGSDGDPGDGDAGDPGVPGAPEASAAPGAPAAPEVPGATAGPVGPDDQDGKAGAA